MAKPNELWQTLETLGLPNKKNSPSNICLKNKNDLLCDLLSVAETFKKYYSSSAENLVLKLRKPLNNFGIQLVNNYYKNCNMKERLLFAKIASDSVFKIIKKFDERKAPEIDDLSGIFLKDGALLLAAPITQLCNCQFLTVDFLTPAKQQYLSDFLKKVSKKDPMNYRPISLLPFLSKLMSTSSNAQK